MRDYDLFAAVVAVLRAGMAMDAATLYVGQNNQPRTAGRPDRRALLLDKIGPDHRYGHVKREDVPDPLNPLQMIHRETQIYETTIQVSTLAKPPPVTGALDVNEPTAADLANQAAAVMQSDATIVALRTLGIGILRITDVRTPHFRNDRDQFEAAPNFDFVLTHKQITVTTTPAAIVGELVVARV